MSVSRSSNQILAKVFDSSLEVLRTSSGGTPTSGTPTISKVTPGTTASLALAADTNRLNALFMNEGTVKVYLGTTSGVTSADGFPIAPGAGLEDNLTTGAWYAVAASGTGDIRILKVAKSS